MANVEDIFASVDIGSEKISVLIAEKEADKIAIFGHATGASAGVKNGHVVNAAELVPALQSVLDKAQKSCNTYVDEIALNLSDPHLKTINQSRSTPTQTGTVTESDMEAAINSASAIATITNKRKLNTTVNHFLLDDDPQPVVSPLQMQATLLSANVHIEIVSAKAYSNLHQAMEKNELAVRKTVLDSVAASEACLLEEDKQAGVCLLDIGAQVSSFSVFTGGGITHSSVLIGGAKSITQAISDAFECSLQEAERLKLEYGHAMLAPGIEDKLIRFTQAPDEQDRFLSQHALIGVIERAYQQLIHTFKEALKEKKLDRALRAGVVLCGGGAKIRACDKLFIQGLRIRTKLAKINTDKISVKESIATDLSYMSALGLLNYVYGAQTDELVQDQVAKEEGGLKRGLKSLFDL